MASTEKTARQWTLRGAIRYRCVCGAPYLIALREASDDEWIETIGKIAASLGTSVIDGTQPQFTCPRCGQLHLRSETAIWRSSASGPASG